jgi:excisionase family DNA binding protein
MQLREAADALGVHYQTAYAWVRQGSLPARKRGRGYEVETADVRALAARRSAGSQPTREVAVRDWPAQADQLYAAIAGGEETHARQWLDRLAAGATLTDLCLTYQVVTLMPGREIVLAARSRLLRATDRIMVDPAGVMT